MAHIEFVARREKEQDMHWNCDPDCEYLQDQLFAIAMKWA